MATPVKFAGCNAVFTGDGDRVSDLPVFKNRGMIVSAWKLTPAELEQVARTGVIFLGIVGQGMPPVIVGDRDCVRRMTADCGGVWDERTMTYEEKTKPCPRCGGSGTLQQPGKQPRAMCPDCGGTGRVAK